MTYFHGVKTVEQSNLGSIRSKVNQTIVIKGESNQVLIDAINTQIDCNIVFYTDSDELDAQEIKPLLNIATDFHVLADCVNIMLTTDELIEDRGSDVVYVHGKDDYTLGVYVGRIVATVAEIGIQHSPSNKMIKNIEREKLTILTHKKGSELNEKNINAIAVVNKKLVAFGDRTSDGKRLQHRLIRYMIGQAVNDSGYDVLDDNMTPAMIDTVLLRIRRYLDKLASQSIIKEPSVSVDEASNGLFTISYDFGGYYPAEQIIFKLTMKQD